MLSCLTDRLPCLLARLLLFVTCLIARLIASSIWPSGLGMLQSIHGYNATG
jgi:hypothetical protein